MHILFLCPHGAAKSVVAVTLARRHAEENGLSATATNAGTDPDPAPSPVAIAALNELGLEYTETPRRVTEHDITEADVVVSLGCHLADLPGTPAHWIDWADAPNASNDVEGLVKFITQRLPDLYK